jgi:hypothetical protein
MRVPRHALFLGRTGLGPFTVLVLLSDDDGRTAVVTASGVLVDDALRAAQAHTSNRLGDNGWVTDDYMPGR